MRQTLYYNKRGVYSNRVCISLADSYPLDTLRAGLQYQTCAYWVIKNTYSSVLPGLGSKGQRILSPTGYESGGLQSFTLYANMCTLLVMFCLTGLNEDSVFLIWSIRHTAQVENLTGSEKLWCKSYKSLQFLTIGGLLEVVHSI